MKIFKLIAGACLLLGGCAGVTSGLPTTASVNGDTWYTKDHYILVHALTTSSDVYYCPKETPDKCIRAEWKEAAK
jgi:hypothetical protein